MKRELTLTERLFNLLKQYPRLTDDFLYQLKKSGKSEGPWSVEIWGRDCDMCESTRIETFDNFTDLLDSFVRFYEGVEWWEGPNTWNILDYDAEESYHQRDRALEAFENGNSYSC